MPRTLPWKRREGEASKPLAGVGSGPVQRIKREDVNRQTGDEVGSASTSSDAGNSSKKRLKRSRESASTSPPPMPPQEEVMIEGIDGDDRYRMVEDEFLATARQFTAHLHAAEYKRLKATSELENAQNIKNISRPVVGQMTDLVKIKKEKNALAKKQRLAAQKLRRGDASGDEGTETDDADDELTSQSLYGLMESPRKGTRPLDGLPSTASATRAAAGYNRQRSDAVRPNRPEPRPPSDTTHRPKNGSLPITGGLNSYREAHSIPQPTSTTPSEMTELSAATIKKLPLNNFPKPMGNVQESPIVTTEHTVVSDDENTDLFAAFKKRQADRKRSREQRKSAGGKIKSEPDDILPDFL